MHAEVEPRDAHTARRQDRVREQRELERQSQRVSWARIACIASAVIGVGWVAFGGLPAQFSVIPAALLVAFMLLVKVHDGIERRLGIATRAVQFHDRALGRIDESYKGSGDEYAVPKDHPYAWDLDIVGKDSLLSRLDCTQTTRGQAALRDALDRKSVV